MIFAAVQTSAEMCVELRKPAGKQRLENGIGVRKFGGQNKGSGQLIYLPVQRALAVDGSRFIGVRRWPLPNSKLVFICGRPFFRRILSSLHRKPERRKRNAHHSAFRQSLHCLIAEHCEGMHLACRLPRQPVEFLMCW